MSVALVTGASRGLGAAMAEALAAAGCAVAVGFQRDERAAAGVCERIAAAGGVAEAFRADVTDPDAVAALHRAVTDRFGDVDVLVAGATGLQPNIALEDLTWPAVLDQLRYFVLSPLLLVQAVLPAMRASGSGRIVMIGSEAAELGTPGASAYVAAKAAQLGLTRAWARELAPDGITVNLVAPGFVPTERHADVDRAERDAYAAGVPLGRLGTPEEVAAAVAFLASPAARFITGQRIAVNGGNTLA